ncbi:hypothetical protein IscW_ISCW004960 [Ixodes scapularis]|uniref:Uncharacterized protein n=1 Tax=Ixodes scapularis TaxID=6945 RepID=B7PIV2_IXOSC|nr:hypothetical protein IscW_ISCW004960 [Ixodes scapularis]|eukprot:XP_002406450.1 hypothetical protein IscW_ISCW004960 [Ixodes scapularis]
MVLATLSKEQGITVVAVCVVYEFLVVQAHDEDDEEDHLEDHFHGLPDPPRLG